MKVDVRFVCATNEDLEEAVQKGEFRADLYYRISVVPIFLPPLRDRKGDLAPLTNESCAVSTRIRAAHLDIVAFRHGCAVGVRLPGQYP